MVSPAHSTVVFTVDDSVLPGLINQLAYIAGKYPAYFTYASTPSSGLNSVQPGTGLAVDVTDPANPIISLSGVDIDYECDTSVNVNDVVAQSNIDLVIRAVATQPLSGRVVGIVIGKSSPTTCKVRIIGPAPGFTNLIPGSQYYLSPSVPGAITGAIPTTIGHVVYRVGFAKNQTTIFVILDEDPVEL